MEEAHLKTELQRRGALGLQLGIVHRVRQTVTGSRRVDVGVLRIGVVDLIGISIVTHLGITDTNLTVAHPRSLLLQQLREQPAGGY